MSILCEKDLENNIPWDCSTDAESYSNVSRFVFIRKKANIADPADSLQWDTAKTAGDLVVYPKVDGTYDGGQPEKGRAYGPKKEQIRKNPHTVKFMVPFKRSDIAFINSANYDNNEGCSFTTGYDEHQFFVSKQVSVVARPLFDKGISEIVDVEFEVTWDSLLLPNAYDVPAAVKSST